MDAQSVANAQAQFSAMKAELDALKLAHAQLQSQSATAPPAPVQAAAAPQYRAPSLRIAPPKEFEGRSGTLSLDDWLSSTQQQLEYHDLAGNEPLMVKTAAVFLKGAALEWWQQLSVRPTTYGSMVDLMRKRFQPIDRADDARVKLKGLRQGKGTVAEFVSTFRRLTAAVPTMGEDDRLFAFKCGVDSRIAKELGMRATRTVDEAIELAMRHDALSSLASASAAVSSSSHAHTPMELDAIEGLEPSTDEKASSAMMREMREMHHEMLAAMQDSRRVPTSAGGSRVTQGAYVPRGLPRISHLSEKQVKEYMEAGKCFGCGMTDHNSRSCPKRVEKGGRASWPQGK